MANRRMFSNRIANSAKFLQMPAESQLLYFHMILRADDDGIVESYPLLKLLGLAPDNFKVLISKGFIKQLNEDQVIIIIDWAEHNIIRIDRKINSIYLPLLREKFPEIPVLIPRPRKDVRDNTRRTGNGQTADSLGKVRLGKVRLGKVKKKGLDKPTTRKEIKFPQEDYTLVIKSYEKLKGVQFSGSEYKPIQQTIKTMFMNKRSKVDIIKCMEWFADRSQSSDRNFEWTQNWTINTIRIKLPEFLANKLGGENEEVIIPGYAKKWIK